MERQDQIRARRRLVTGVGFAMLLVASATACIYDKSDYQGGGRLDKGGEAKTAQPSASSAQPTTTATPTTTDDGGPPKLPVDAGGD